MNRESLAYEVVTLPTRPINTVLICERSLLLVFVGFENLPENLNLKINNSNKRFCIIYFMV